MNEIHGIYEVAIPVKNLERAEEFYLGVLGLESGLRQDERRWHFLRAGGQAGMLVLQETAGDWPVQHFTGIATSSITEPAGRSWSLRRTRVRNNKPILVLVVASANFTLFISHAVSRLDEKG